MRFEYVVALFSEEEEIVVEHLTWDQIAAIPGIVGGSYESMSYRGKPPKSKTGDSSIVVKRGKVKAIELEAGGTYLVRLEPSSTVFDLNGHDLPDGESVPETVRTNGSTPIKFEEDSAGKKKVKIYWLVSVPDPIQSRTISRTITFEPEAPVESVPNY